MTVRETYGQIHIEGTAACLKGDGTETFDIENQKSLTKIKQFLFAQGCGMYWVINSTGLAVWDYAN